MSEHSDGLDAVRENRQELEALAERDDLRTAKYARALLDAIDETDAGE